MTETADHQTHEENSTQERDADRTSDERGRDADSPTEIPAQGWKEIALRIKDEFKDGHATLTAAGVAFFAFLALVPLLIAGVFIDGLFANPSDVTSLVDRLGSSVPGAVRDLIEQQLDSIATTGSGALGVAVVIGILTALWSASSGIDHLNEGMNIAYDETEDRPFWRRRGLAILMTLVLLVFLAVVATIITVATQAGSGVVGLAILAVGWIVVALLFAAMLAGLYRYGPDRDDPEWQWASPGAIIAGILGTIVSIGFGFYVSQFGSYNETYGSLGAIVVMLMWLYLSAVVIVLGAEINAEMEHQTAQDTTVGGDEPIGTRDAAVADDVGEASD